LARRSADGTIAAMTPAPAIVWSPRYECDIGPHVFPVRKYGLVVRRLLDDGVITAADVLEPEMPPRDALALVHTPGYLDDLEQLRHGPSTWSSELPLTREIVTAYALAAAGTTLATRRALAFGTAVHVGGGFHHAFAEHAEGFCYLNDLAVGIRVAQRDGLIRRAAVVDLDVHQGNGTARLFEGDASVFTLSIHQEANYPMPKMHSDLDVGLADGVGDAEYLEALDRALEAVWQSRPEVVLYQAGADPYRDDQLGGLALTFDGLEARDRRVLEGCAQRGIASVVTLGGGYARREEDTVEIHSRTARIAFERSGKGSVRA
jgi:acetoin utilization deacetylase AcuC-like enzyme